MSEIAKELERFRIAHARGLARDVEPISKQAVREGEDLIAAVTRVVAQRGDDICWRDVYTELAQLVGVDPTPHLMCDQAQFLSNCKRFDESLRTGGKYVPIYP